MGYKHREETIAKFKARRHSKETKKRISALQKGNKNRLGKTLCLKNCLHDTDLRSTERKYLKLRKDNKNQKDLVNLLNKSQFLIRKKNETTIYDSIREAARALDIPNSSIRRNLKTVTLYKDRYIYKKV